MAHEMSIEVLDGEFPASLWMEAWGDTLVEVALQCQVIEWRWQHFGWGTVLEIVFADEAAWDRFRAGPAVQAALDAVPDRVSGLMIYRGGAARRPRGNRGAPARSLVPVLRHWSFPTTGSSSPPPRRHRYCPSPDARGAGREWLRNRRLMASGLSSCQPGVVRLPWWP